MNKLKSVLQIVALTLKIMLETLFLGFGYIVIYQLIFCVESPAPLAELPLWSRILCFVMFNMFCIIIFIGEKMNQKYRYIKIKEENK